MCEIFWEIVEIKKRQAYFRPYCVSFNCVSRRKSSRLNFVDFREKSGLGEDGPSCFKGFELSRTNYFLTEILRLSILPLTLRGYMYVSVFFRVIEFFWVLVRCAIDSNCPDEE